MEDSYYLITFNSTHRALKFEDSIDRIEIFGELVPLPRDISADCGLAGKFAETDLEAVKSLCQQEDIEYEAIYRRSEIYRGGVDNEKD